MGLVSKRILKILVVSRFPVLFLRFECEFSGCLISHKEGASHEEIELYRGADRTRVEAGGDRDAGRLSDPPHELFEADVFPVEDGLQWAWRR